MNGTNGTHPDPRLMVATFGFQEWRTLTAKALAEGERRYAAAREHFEEAAQALNQRLAELDVLRRALELEPITRRVVGAPTPPGKGSRPATEAEGLGQGPGFRASRYILEVAVQRFRHSGQTAFSARTITLACRGWPETTIASGLKRLLKDGYIERTARGQYGSRSRGSRRPRRRRTCCR